MWAWFTTLPNPGRDLLCSSNNTPGVDHSTRLLTGANMYRYMCDVYGVRPLALWQLTCNSTFLDQTVVKIAHVNQTPAHCAAAWVAPSERSRAGGRGVQQPRQAVLLQAQTDASCTCDGLSSESYLK